MTKNKILEVIRIYKKMLTEKGISKKEFPHKEGLFNPEDALQHISAMIPKIEKFLKEGRVEKSFRWLGFIQGALWVIGVYTLDELKNHNRPKNNG